MNRHEVHRLIDEADRERRESLANPYDGRHRGPEQNVLLRDVGGRRRPQHARPDLMQLRPGQGWRR